MNGFPFTNFHDINLDWILSKLKKAVFSINGQGPDENGNINLGGVAGVTSVNGVGPDSAGNVTLNAGNVGALPATYTAPVSSVNGKTGNVQLSASDVNALSNAYQPPVRSVNGQTGAVDLDASDVGALPEDWEAPVTSVNQMTGEINLTASDVGALPDTTTVPTRTSQLVNDSGYITSQQASAVTSVNGKVGAVVLDASDVSALPASTVVPTMTSQLVNDSGYITSAQAAPVSSVNSKVGAVVLDAADVGATPAGEGIPAGGTTGQILTKSSASDYDAAWEDAPNPDWQLVGTSTTITATMTYPENAKEIFVIFKFSGYSFSNMAPVSALPHVWSIGGYYFSSSDTGICNVNHNAGRRTIEGRNAKYGNTSFTNWELYWR